MDTITTLTLRGQDINILVKGKEVGYTMEIDGQHYGSKVLLPSRKVKDIASAIGLLLINAIEVKDALCSQANSPSSLKNSTPDSK